MKDAWRRIDTVKGVWYSNRCTEIGVDPPSLKASVGKRSKAREAVP